MTEIRQGVGTFSQNRTRHDPLNKTMGIDGGVDMRDERPATLPPVPPPYCNEGDREGNEEYRGLWSGDQ